MVNLFRYLLAVGLENGEIKVYGCQEGDGGDLKCESIAAGGQMKHTLAVKRLKWRPRTDSIFLASCSLDHCVKIFRVSF